MTLRRMRFGLAIAGFFASIALAANTHALTKQLNDGLDSATYVYIATERKDGTFGKPAEIWFLHHQGAVWVASPPSTWRVQRIKKGRTKAKVYVGKADGPSFNATGSLSKDTAVHEVMFKAFAKKYGDRWTGYEKRFRDGLADGSRVLIKYQPTE